MKKLAEYYNCTSKDFIAAGDGENDICMLKESGCGVATGNSADLVKKFADIVIGDNDSDSLSEFPNFEFLK